MTTTVIDLRDGVTPVAPPSRHDIRCASCRRRLAITASATALRNSVFCDEWCEAEVPATPLEERNDSWRWLYASGWTPVKIARKDDVAHSLVYRTLAKP